MIVFGNEEANINGAWWKNECVRLKQENKKLKVALANAENIMMDVAAAPTRREACIISDKWLETLPESFDKVAEVLRCAEEYAYLEISVQHLGLAKPDTIQARNLVKAVQELQELYGEG